MANTAASLAPVPAGTDDVLVAPPTDLAIATQALTKHYGSRPAVRELDITVPRGVIAGFVGPNGAGKTTTIRMLLGLVRPTHGTASVLGHSIQRPSRYLSRVGALIEGPAFYPTLSGRKNLEVLARLGGHPIARVGELLELVGLADRARDQVRTYSMGMKQRLGVAMALLPDPELLILDEPTNGLDPPGIIEVRDLMRRLRNQGKTIFVSSHLLGEVEQVADWLVMLKDGRALFCGHASDVGGGQSGLIVAVEHPGELEIVAAIARAQGYVATARDHRLEIVCPDGFAAELNRRAHQAGVTLVEIRRHSASLEETFLTMVGEDN